MKRVIKLEEDSMVPKTKEEFLANWLAHFYNEFLIHINAIKPKKESDEFQIKMNKKEAKKAYLAIKKIILKGKKRESYSSKFYEID